jgi:hypothetical protein
MHVLEAFNWLKSQRDLLRVQEQRALEEVEAYRATLETSKTARALLDEAIRLSYESLKSDLERSGTTILRQQFVGREFNFIVDIDKKQFRISEHGEEFNIEADQGGGMLDILSITLREIIDQWQQSNNPARPLLWLDEPLKFLGHGPPMERGIQMLKVLSENYGLQLIINTHNDEIAQLADKAYRLTHNGTYVEIEEL